MSVSPSLWIYLCIGLGAGVLSGNVRHRRRYRHRAGAGAPGEFSTKTALGTSLGALLLPVGLLGAYAYWENGNLDVRVSLLIAVGLTLGVAVGARLAQVAARAAAPAALRRVHHGVGRPPLARGRHPHEARQRRLPRRPADSRPSTLRRRGPLAAARRGPRSRSRPGASRSSWTTPTRRAGPGSTGCMFNLPADAVELSPGVPRDAGAQVGRAAGRQRLGRRGLRRALSPARRPAPILLSAVRARLHAQSRAGHQSLRRGSGHVRSRAGRVHTDGDLPAMMTPIHGRCQGCWPPSPSPRPAPTGARAAPTPSPSPPGTFRNAAGERVGLATLTDSAGTAAARGERVAARARGRTASTSTRRAPALRPTSRPRARTSIPTAGSTAASIPRVRTSATCPTWSSAPTARRIPASPWRTILRSPAHAPCCSLAVPRSSSMPRRTTSAPIPSGNSGDRVACAVIEPG